MAEAGILISCGPLRPPAATTTVRVRGGETLLTDGPAAEIKEHFGGYTLVECEDLDEALRWAARIPAASEGQMEVRPDGAVAAYRSELRLDLPAGERKFVDDRIRAILADCDFLADDLRKPAGERRGEPQKGAY